MPNARAGAAGTVIDNDCQWQCGEDVVDRSALSARIQGELLAPGDDGFDDARLLWNARFDRRPDLIARCTSRDDVKAAVVFARERDMHISVKGGGHSYAAKSVADGGLLIDLSPMKEVTVDVGARTVMVEAGVTCGEMDAATQSHGLATPAPTVSSVGVIGAALGGGTGYLSRAFGMMIDNVISAEVVTADGQILRAAPDENDDLYWALRGGGGNFGVVTSIELRLHEIGPQVLAGQIIYPFDDAAHLFRAYRDFMATAPDEFQCYAFSFRIPPIDAFPEDTHGQPVIDFVLLHHDPSATAFVQPLRDLGEPILDLVGPNTYVETQKVFDANLPKGQRYLSKAHHLESLSDGALDTMVQYIPDMAGEFTIAYFDPQGGAIGRVDPASTPYGGRAADYGFHCLAGWVNAADDDAVISWASAFQDAMSAHATGGVYVNLIAEDEAERIPRAYGDNYKRVVSLKQVWDPSNAFRSNYNIRPD